MSCWQFQTKKKTEQPELIIENNTTDYSESSTHQLLESNVTALEKLSQDSESSVRERVANWLESSIVCRDQEERSFTDRIFQRLATSSKAMYEKLWREPHQHLLERCESSFSGLSCID